MNSTDLDGMLMPSVRFNAINMQRRFAAFFRLCFSDSRTPLYWHATRIDLARAGLLHTLLGALAFAIFLVSLDTLLTPVAAMSGELLTQLQDQLNVQSEQLFNCIGKLQRDAPPQALDKEPVIAPTPENSIDVQEETQRMTQELIEQFKITEELIQKIPQDEASEEEQYARIRALQEEHVQVAQELAQALEDAEQLLEQYQQAYARLARHQLQQSAAAVHPP